MTWIYAVTLFVSATLLFSIQPMIGKTILPALGGAPAVWNTCMVFFQAMLLVGYAYAHGASRVLKLRTLAIVHLLLLGLAIAFPPLLQFAKPPTADASPILWLLLELLATVGFPFFVIAASAPMLQRWFAASSHTSARDPYFLYAASNAGSLLVLLAYPLLIEPFATLPQQALSWRIVYAIFLGLAVCCAFTLWRTKLAPESIAAPTTTVTHKQRTRWLILSAIPSSLMLGVTAHITTNVAAIPLFWVIPLALYLLTFVIVFARKQWVRPIIYENVLPWIALMMGPTFFVALPTAETATLIGHLSLFFIAALVCHHRLATSRPDASHLTEYYLWLAGGGVLGGLFNTLIAPSLFSEVIEYPLMAVAACFVRFSVRSAKSNQASRLTKNLDILWPVMVIALGVLTVMFTRTTDVKGTFGELGILFLLMATLVAVAWKRSIRFAASYAVCLLVIGVYVRMNEGQTLHVERNFFGVKRVVATPDGQLRSLYHGTTIHGMQWKPVGLAGEPLVYYHRTGPVGDLFRHDQQRHPQSNVAAMGLGVGAVAAYARPDDTFTYIEIDPAVARIAQDTRYFTFLAGSQGKHDVQIGDGRLLLQEQPDARFNVIFLDAYSSDAVPTHLLTREALAIYMSKLADDGLLVFHVSNRIMNIEPVVADLARDAGLFALARMESINQFTDEQVAFGIAPAHIVVVARRESDISDLAQIPGWRKAVALPNQRVWTDDYADILSLLRRGPADVATP